MAEQGVAGIAPQAQVEVFAACWQVGIWTTTAALAWIDMKRNASLVNDRATAGSLGIISIIVRGLIWAVVLLLTLDNSETRYTLEFFPVLIVWAGFLFRSATET